MRNIQTKITAFEAFRHYIGLSILVATIGFTYSGIRGNDLRFEIADTKIVLSGKIAKTQLLATQLELAITELENTKLAYTELREKYDLLLARNSQARELLPQVEQVDKAIGKQDLETLKREVGDTQRELNQLSEELADDNVKR